MSTSSAVEDDGPPASFVIVGAGGHGRELLDIVDASGRRDAFAGFVDDSTLDAVGLDRLARRQTAVIGTVPWLATVALSYVIGIGSSSVRRQIDTVLAAAAAPALLTTLIHPSAVVGSEVRLAAGTVIGAMATITTNVDIGRHSHVNVGCSVQHDTRLGEFVTLSPGVFVNGDVTIGNDVFVGTGAIITRGTIVGDGATIGAGAVILRDVPPGSRVVGVPGRSSTG